MEPDQTVDVDFRSPTDRDRERVRNEIWEDGMGQRGSFEMHYANRLRNACHLGSTQARLH